MQEPAPHFREVGQIPEPKAAIEAGNLSEALSGFATRHVLEYRMKLRMSSDGDLCGFGVTLWLMGDRLGAAYVWSTVCDEALKNRFKYSGSGTYQGGFLLWFASVWLKDEDWHDEAAALLDKLLKRKRPAYNSHSFARLARLLRREMDLEEVRACFDKSPEMREDEERPALFYAGVRAFEGGDVEETRRLWNQVKEPSYSQCELEYYLLVHERQKLTS